MSHTTARRVEPHDHAHEHGHTGWPCRVWHELSEAVGGHSHDASGQVDDVLEADAPGRRALLLSLAVLGLTAAVQGAVVVLPGSVARWATRCTTWQTR